MRYTYYGHNVFDQHNTSNVFHTVETVRIALLLIATFNENVTQQANNNQLLKFVTIISAHLCTPDLVLTPSVNLL